MSFQVLAIVERINFKNVSRKAVAKQLASCANPDGGSIYPAVDYVAKHTDCSERTVQRCIKGLLQADILTLVRLGGKGRRSTNEYAYNMPLLKALDEGACEIYSYKNEKKQSCLGVRTVGEQELCNDNQLVKSKGDSVSPLKFSKGDTVSSKGDNASRKGDTVTPNPFKEPFKEEEGREGQQQRGHHAGQIEPETTPPTAVDLKILFDEYNATARRAGFKLIDEQYFEDVADELERTIAKVGAEKWRECLGLAAGDDLCCGRVKAGANYASPWRLDFKQMCKPLWIDEKLDEWKRAGKQPKTHNAAAMTITPTSASWPAWQEHFEATNHKFNLKRMARGEPVAVPSEWPPLAEMQQAGGAR